MGGDLTDLENNLDDTVSGGAYFNWIDASATSEPNFSPADGGHEAAFDVFDNKVGAGHAKWCCGPPEQHVAVQFQRAYQLTHFTIAAGNDTVGRDPTVWVVVLENRRPRVAVVRAFDKP
ncbi:MAG: hypothetical protein AAFX50_18910, partial [Acidobacteriota bacterium]